MSQTEHTCCGVVDEVRARRSQVKPQPWIVRKLAVALTILIAGYATYVYTARFCKDMITKNNSALGSQATGVVFLVVYCILLCLMSWCYVVVITTSPGDARLYTQRTTKPGYDPTDRSSTLNSSDIRGTFYELTAPTHPPTLEPHHPYSSLGSGKSKAGASQLSVTASAVAKLEQPAVEATRAADGTHANSSSHPPPMPSRRPTTTPVLLPEYRYCNRCQIVKPSRTHHCRSCGTCVLKYDHHCPWIGQCVGAFNQKFFVHFLQWGTMLCFWTFSTLLGLNVAPRTPPAPALDPQQIVVIVLAGLLSLFYSLILLVQIHLVLLNQTTVESLSFRSMREREQELLSQMHTWYQCRAKRATRQRWDDEWGRIGIEGNLWWLGSRRENWVAVMGENVWGWFLPIRGHVGDGLNYPTNPRFDAAGRWKRRKEWPSDLQ